MLDVSRIEDGRFNYAFEPADIREALDKAVVELEPRIREKRIVLGVDQEREVPLVTMDKDKIRLVFYNLLENAVEYSPAGGRVGVRIEAGSDLCRIRISDRGAGIPAAEQSRVFSKFYRGTNVLRIQTDGSGLGLYIVKNVIEEHGGEIRLESKEGEGTEVVFTLPIQGTVR
jgi:signal transduction histidine kinase